MNNLNQFSSFYIKSKAIVNGIWKGFARMATEDSKRAKIMPKIGTHSGTFHCDEALACFMLKQLPEYENAAIIRTRDNKVLNECDVVVDVGGEYNPKTHRYDHHQRDFDQSLSSVQPDLAKNKNIRLSSAGLVYAHFGFQVISEILKRHNQFVNTSGLRNIFLFVYDQFVEELDAIDNGIPMYPEGKPRYRINTHLSARVHRLNPEWNTPEPENLDEIFGKAMDLVGGEFTDKVLEAVSIWWPAREIVRKAIEDRQKIHETGEIILLEERCPWKDHLIDLEEEMKMGGEIKFVLFHDTTGTWRVQAVPLQPDSFICRCFLHKDWRGVRDEELSDISGIPGSIFCHATGFIGGNKTKEGVLQMAIRSLNASLENKE